MKRKCFGILGILGLSLLVSGCGTNNEIEQLENDLEKVVSEVEGLVGEEQQVSNMVNVGEEYVAGDLSYNVLNVTIDDGVLVVKMEIFNNTSEGIDFSPISTLALFNENNEECDWNIMVGQLGGLIMPNSKIIGETGFDLDGKETENYILHIGEVYDLFPAIEINSSDMNKDFNEIFENAAVESSYSIGDVVESDGFDVLISDASIKNSDKASEEILLINLSLKNNSKEERTLGFEIKGVYTKEGEELETEYSSWTFQNYGIESGETATGIISYTCDEGQTEFYMVVSPDIYDFSRSEIITFSV